MVEFKDRVLLITGGTGSFGNAVLRRFLDTEVREIRIFSRDEKKQDDMRQIRFWRRKRDKYYTSGNARSRLCISRRRIETGSQL